MLRSIRLRWVCFLCLCALLFGCQQSNSGPKTTPDGRRIYRIAVIPKGTTHDFWKSVHAGAMQAAEELGTVEILWNGPPNEADKEGQIKIVDTFVAQKVDGICLAPIDRDAMIPPVKRAKQRGIPTVIFDSGLSDLSSAVSYVATDNKNGGIVAGEALAKLLGEKGGVILLRYQAGSESTEMREAGFIEAIEKHPGITVLSESQRVDSSAEQALKIAETLLRAHKDKVSGVFTVCEPINKGMIQALENEQLAGKVKFIAFDSDPRLIAGLKNGSVSGIVLQNPVRMGYLAVKTMVDHLEGRPVEPRVQTGEVLATPENMNDDAVRALLEPKQI